MKASRVCSGCFRASQARLRQTLQLESLSHRVLQRHAPLQASTRSNFSTTTSRRESSSLTGANQPPKKSKVPLLFSLTAAVLGGAAYYGLSGESEDDSLNGTKFTPFNIIAKEQVSPTAFIITIRCPEKVSARNNAKIKAAWDHGLWSVEMKQPQLQIARHYTPLPPLDGPAMDDGGDLRFLIRKMDSGEMSNYLARLQVGDQVWLRGPHYGFDISKRMGDAKDVVFLAGGTGVAPALQIAHKLLNNMDGAAGGRQPRVQILWANRRNVDSLGRDMLTGKTKKTFESTAPDTLTRQVVEMKRRYGDSFDIRYFVDGEKFITLKDITAAMDSQGSSRERLAFAATDKRCHWHSHQGLVATSDDDDRATADSPCSCRPHNLPPEPIGRNLICVSGPDGFIEAFAGPKRWFGGREIQGPVLGLLGSMKRMDPKMDDWLVLKM